MDSFHMFLPSNVYDFTGRNTIGNYVTHLPTTVKLHGNWEVGLSEILYTKTWYNIVEDEDLRIYAADKGVTQWTCPVKAGCYRDFHDVVKQMNECLQKICSMLPVRQEFPTPIPPKVKVTSDGQRVVLIPGIWENLKTMPILTQSLRDILGFNKYEDVNFQTELNLNGNVIKGAMVAERPVDIKANIHSLYVYCDIVKSSVVGDSYSKLLRVVSVPNSGLGSTEQKIYENPLFFPVEKKEFQTIEIDVKDDVGETLKFDTGRIVVVLNFRRRNE